MGFWELKFWLVVGFNPEIESVITICKILIYSFLFVSAFLMLNLGLTRMRRWGFRN
jgi:hypothetical protein